jgi:hypothetical protein
MVFVGFQLPWTKRLCCCCSLLLDLLVFLRFVVLLSTVVNSIHVLIVVFVIGCVGGCDDILKDLMEISRFGSRSQAATPGF